ncbi:MAG: apolipoprotein N-acyltransferase [Fimbriimonadaceae bacterium]|nr:apolipoprotein N-acyltransferase [Alphaproteobacteria bacterium]
MQALAQAFVVMWGWRRIAAAFIAGAASVLAMPPFDLFPVLLLTFPVLVWLIDGIGAPQKTSSTGRLGGLFGGCFSAAFLGWVFGFGYFLAGLYWVGAAFLVEAEKFALLMPLAVVMLPAGLALFHALGVTLAYLLWSNGAMRIVALAVGLTIGEWLRGHILTGFPWNLIGYALTGYNSLMQGAGLIGIEGLTFLAIFIAASPAALGTIGMSSMFRRALPLGVAAVVLAGLTTYGVRHLAAAQAAFAETVRLRIVQPNVAQTMKWLPENRSAIFSRLLTMSDEATSPETTGIRDVTHVIWPETAVPFLLAEAPDAQAAIAAMLPPGSKLITGSVRRHFDPDATDVAASMTAFNSILVFDDEARILATYDKVHLVPFGEYLPFSDILAKIGFKQLTQIRSGFGAGTGRRNYSVADTPDFVPLICYEIIFSGTVTSPTERPKWLLNLTNDAWFGNTSGPYQHFRQARVRAVEEGLPVIRAANTGISAVIDPYGRILEQIPVNATGVIDSRLPRALPPTIFAQYRSAGLIALLCAGLLIIMGGKWRTARARRLSMG